MKIIAQFAEAISYTDSKGDLRPLRLRIQAEDGTLKVIKVDKVITKEHQKLAGNEMLVFKCQSLIENVQRLFEIRYELKTCRWMLYKI